MDKESNAGLGIPSYLPPEILWEIYDLLLFDSCTKHTKSRTIRELNNLNPHLTSEVVR